MLDFLYLIVIYYTHIIQLLNKKIIMNTDYFENDYLFIVVLLCVIAMIVFYRWIIAGEKWWLRHPIAVGINLPLALWTGVPWWGKQITSNDWIFIIGSSYLDLHDISVYLFWLSMIGLIYMKVFRGAFEKDHRNFFWVLVFMNGFSRIRGSPFFYLSK